MFTDSEREQILRESRRHIAERHNGGGFSVTKTVTKALPPIDVEREVAIWKREREADDDFEAKRRAAKREMRREERSLRYTNAMPEPEPAAVDADAEPDWIQPIAEVISHERTREQMAIAAATLELEVKIGAAKKEIDATLGERVGELRGELRGQQRAAERGRDRELRALCKRVETLTLELDVLRDALAKLAKVCEPMLRYFNGTG